MGRDQVVEDMMLEMGKALIGKESSLELIIIALLAKGHVLLEDVPGVGKTTLAKALAEVIQGSFNRIQFTPDTLPSDITGVSIYNMKTSEFEFHKGSIMNQIILADEINRTSPKTQASLLEAMEEEQVTVDGHTYALPNPFMVIATQNPIEYIGTYPLPEAQLDRFMMKMSMGYPDEESEENMLIRYLDNAGKVNIEPVVTATDILRMQQEVQKVTVKKDIVSYLIRIIDKTRASQDIELGASPRAALSLLRAAQAKAYVNGRNYAIPDDVKKMVKPVLGHRLKLTAEAQYNHQTADKLLSAILTSVTMPTI